ncbi:hypothetical protein CEF12_11650 [Enterococcus faecalis]|uniref:hypothetical protein n=1 Tax=Enterococcus TaxID=1350 RepID=UPI000B9C8DE1|nr:MULTISPECIES: hypothetical protein [Enterococcus]DAI07583.1 MAG TPA: hypothetical protein [Caudoviricetes sp.]EGO8615854.1 hypothetical protein [Enterococcus faecalis]EJE4062804.1 hypothetical protein [Enterococcus faecalis]EKS9971041.1 hypothetical protein [Enterococcus faecalis]MBW7653119.1 hypothetical protein [Enterococcus faecalis]
MKLIHKHFIGHNTEIVMVYSEGRYTVSICISNLKDYCNQLYRNFEDLKEAEQFYLSLSKLEDQR